MHVTFFKWDKCFDLFAASLYYSSSHWRKSSSTYLISCMLLFVTIWCVLKMSEHYIFFKNWSPFKETSVSISSSWHFLNSSSDPSMTSLSKDLSTILIRHRPTSSVKLPIAPKAKLKPASLPFNQLLSTAYFSWIEWTSSEFAYSMHNTAVYVSKVTI